MIEDIIKDLQACAEPDGTLTRQHYREVGKYTIHAIQGSFGTFRAARRAAGLDPSIGQNQFLNQIARHTDHDVYRKFNIERADYGDKYRREDTKRFQTMLVCSDVHDIEVDPFWERCFLDSVKRICPDKVVLGGDIFDLPEFGKYNVDPREWDVTGRIKKVHEFLAAIREAAPTAELVFVEGNHEARLLRHLSEATPALKSILSDLHGFTVPKLLGLDTYEVRYVARADLATFNQSNARHELGKNYEVFYDQFIVDHFPTGIRRGVPGINGHHHIHQLTTFSSFAYGPSEWHQLGSGHRRQASYCDGEMWSMGFAIVHCDTQEKKSITEYIDIKDFSCIGGKYYIREPNEI